MPGYINKQTHVLKASQSHSAGINQWGSTIVSHLVVYVYKTGIFRFYHPKKMTCTTVNRQNQWRSFSSNDPNLAQADVIMTVQTDVTVPEPRFARGDEINHCEYPAS